MNRPLVACALAALLALLPHIGALGHGFVYDDAVLVADNPLVNGPLDLGRIFRSEYWAPAKMEGLYRPLTIASFAVLGANAAAQHAVNLLLHAAVAALLTWIALRAGGRPAGALVAGALFAVHPVHVEAVVPVSGRADVLGGALALAAVLAGLARGRAAWGFGPLLGLALLAKESSLLAPVLLALLLVASGRARDLRRPALVLGLVSAVAAAAALKVQATGRLDLDRTRITRLANPIVHLDPVRGRLTALAVASIYGQRLFVPWRLASDYSYDQVPAATTPFDPRVATGLGVLAALAGLAWTLRRARPLAATGLAHLALGTALASNLLLPFGTIAAERLLYLPSAGLCLAAGAALGDGRGRRRAAAFASLLVGLFGVRSALRTPVWSDDLRLFEAQVAEAPQSAIAHSNLGHALHARGRHAEAEAAYRRSFSIAPFSAVAANGVGLALRAQGDAAQALEWFERAAALGPDLPQAWANLAPERVRAGRIPEAIAAYRSWLALDPNAFDALVNLGAILATSARAGEAATLLERAVTLRPSSFEAWFNLALARARAGQPPERGEQAARRAVALRPDGSRAHELLADLLAAGGRAGEARAEAARALELARDDASRERVRAKLAALPVAD